MQTYADFLTVGGNYFGPVIFYVDLTGSGGPFLAYVVSGSNGSGSPLMVVRVKLDAKPASFSTDWPAGAQKQLNSPPVFS